MKPVFALIDCNNFFVSCQKLFQPGLEGKPVVVLSSNDGCVISRSNEAKAIGISMGAPVFKYRQLFKQHRVVQFSVNFELYGDISQRITRLLTGVTPRTEVYSVDEAFLDLSTLNIEDYTEWGRALRQRTLNEIGIPVSIGIAPSKTLAKLAVERAKKDPELADVLELVDLDLATKQRYLLQTPIKDIWGIGWRLAPKLKAEGIYNALDLSRMRPRQAQALMGIHGRQLVAELNGTACHSLEMFGKVRQSIMHGRLFGEDTNQFNVIEAAIASLTAKAAWRLRRENLLTFTAAVYLATNHHKPGYAKQRQSIRFRTPTADTGLITATLVQAAYNLFNSGRQYHRADVLLVDLASQHHIQPDFFGEVDLAGNQAALNRLQAFDSINSRFGKHTIYYAAEDLSQAWEPKHRLRSPRYTTNWHELPVAKILN